jgi:hypothetical protein
MQIVSHGQHFNILLSNFGYPTTCLDARLGKANVRQCTRESIYTLTSTIYLTRNATVIERFNFTPTNYRYVRLPDKRSYFS